MITHEPVRPVDEVWADTVAAARAVEHFGVPGYARFKFLHAADNAVTLERRNGNPVSIRKRVLTSAIEAVRAQHSFYIDGPAAFRKIGITHINSPVWALTRLLTLNQIIE